MTITTAAAFYRAANGQQVRRTIEGQPVLETWPETVADIRRQLLEQGCEESAIVENDKGLKWPGGFMLRPRQRREETGLFVARSKDYTFTNPELRDGAPIYGDKAGGKVEAGRLVKALPGGARVTFELLGGAE